MSLRHVRMWCKDKWESISSHEASELFSRSVKASEKRFICALCKQWIIFVSSTKRSSHFKHSKSEQDKECEDRARALAKGERIFSRKAIADTIRVCVSGNGLYVEIGFPPMSTALFDDAEKLEAKVHIMVGEKTLLTKNINEHNFSSNRTEFHPIGNVFLNKYTLKVTPDEFVTQYPQLNRELDGINLEGTLFDYQSDVQSGPKIPLEDTIEIKTKYYLLTNRHVGNCNDVDVKKIAHDKACTLYLVYAKKITNESIMFFFTFKYNLISSSKLIPAWPIVQEVDQQIETNKQPLYFLFTGDSHLTIEPEYLKDQISINEFSVKNSGKLIHIKNISNIRMLWNAKLLKNIRISKNEKPTIRQLSFYYIDSEITKVNLNDEPISIYTDDQKPLDNGVHAYLPIKKRLHIKTVYDGKVIHRRENRETRLCKKLKAAQPTILEMITWGDTIEIYQGLDKVAALSFTRGKKGFATNDTNLYSTLLACHGRLVPFSHRHTWIFTHIIGMPKTKLYVQNAVNVGFIRIDALSILINTIKEVDTYDNYDKFAVHGST